MTAQTCISSAAIRIWDRAAAFNPTSCAVKEDHRWLSENPLNLSAPGQRSFDWRAGRQMSIARYSAVPHTSHTGSRSDSLAMQ